MMCEDSMLSDVTSQAVFEVLCAADAVTRALAEADAAGASTHECFAKLIEFRHKNIEAESFTKDATKILRDLADDLEPSISDETTTWFVYDEYDTSGGHDETFISSLGWTLIGLRSALRHLAERTSKVVNLEEADRIAEARKR